MKSRKVNVIGMFVSLLMVIVALVLLQGCATSKTASVQSAPVSYVQGVSEDGQTDYIHMTLHILFRKVPEKGATARFMSALGNVINDLNVIGAVTSLGTQPERMISRLEDGTRAHIAIPIKVPLPDNRDTEISIDTNDIKQATDTAAEEADVEELVENVYVSGINVNVKSTVVGGDEG